MKTKSSRIHITLTFAAIAAMTTPLVGADSQTAATDGKNADAAWGDLQQKSRPSPSLTIRVEKDKASADSKSKIAQQADQAWQASLQARSFYSQFPTHPKANDARKLEAINAVYSIRDGNPDHERSALTASQGTFTSTYEPRFPILKVADGVSATAAREAKADRLIQRGQMVPNQAMKCQGSLEQGQTAQIEGFSVANIVPQMARSNVPTWSARPPSLRAANLQVSGGRLPPAVKSQTTVAVILTINLGNHLNS